MWWKLVDDKINRPDAEGRGMEEGHTISVNLQGDVELCFILVTAMEIAVIVKPLFVQKTIHDISDFSIFSPMCFFLL